MFKLSTLRILRLKHPFEFLHTGVMVMYSSTHSGHDKNLKHTVLSQLNRQHLAGRISMGIQFDEIMEKVQDNHSSAELTRLHLLKRMDLNISSSCHLSKIRHKNDAESVRIWVEMCRQEKSETS